MMKHNNYKPNTLRLYFPLMTFCISLVLTLTDVGLYHFWKYANTYLLVVNGLAIVGLTLIVTIKLAHSTFIDYFKSLSLTWHVRHMLVIPKQFNDFMNKTKLNPTSDIYNTYLRQTYGEFIHNNMFICVRIPNNIEAAKLLDDKFTKLRESIVNQYSDYSFTGFERKGFYLIMAGSK